MLLNGGHTYTGILYVLLSPLFIGLYEDETNTMHEGYIRMSILCFYAYYYLILYYDKSKVEACDVGIRKGKRVNYIVPLSPDRLRQLLLYTLNIITFASEHDNTNLVGFGTTSNEAFHGLLRRNS